MCDRNILIFANVVHYFWKSPIQKYENNNWSLHVFWIMPCVCDRNISIFVKVFRYFWKTTFQDYKKGIDFIWFLHFSICVTEQNLHIRPGFSLYLNISFWAKATHLRNAYAFCISPSVSRSNMLIFAKVFHYLWKSQFQKYKKPSEFICFLNDYIRVKYSFGFSHMPRFFTIFEQTYRKTNGNKTILWESFIFL